MDITPITQMSAVKRFHRYKCRAVGCLCQQQVIKVRREAQTVNSDKNIFFWFRGVREKYFEERVTLKIRCGKLLDIKKGTRSEEFRKCSRAS